MTPDRIVHDEANPLPPGIVTSEGGKVTMTDTHITYKIPGSFMHMSFEKPPVWENVMTLFKINVGGTLFTYGDTLYNPAGVQIPADYIHHEEVHAEQQGHSTEHAAKWWARYFQDQYFRIDQEARAYAVQYDWWCENDKVRGRDRNWRSKKLRELAITLASPMYGSVVSVTGATSLIKHFSKTR